MVGIAFELYGKAHCKKQPISSHNHKANKMIPANLTTQPVNFQNDPRLSRETRSFLNVLNGAGGPPLESLTPEQARLVLVGAQESVAVDLSGTEESEKDIVSGAYPIKLNIMRPEGVKGILPVFIFIHGGGWVLGDYPTHKRMVRDLVVLSGCAGVFVNYTPAPERQYPHQINEIYAAVQWVAENGNEIQVDGSKLAIVGNSAGGDMAAATCLMAKAKGGPDIKLQILFWPVTDTDFETNSYQEFGNDRFLTASLMKWMFEQYSADPKSRDEIYFSPLKASLEQLKGLPPALIQVAENDILRDEGEAYGRKLDEAGVPVTLVRYNGMIHDFGLLNALAELPATRSLFEQAAAALKKHLV